MEISIHKNQLQYKHDLSCKTVPGQKGQFDAYNDTSIHHTRAKQDMFLLDHALSLSNDLSPAPLFPVAIYKNLLTAENLYFQAQIKLANFLEINPEKLVDPYLYLIL